MYSHYNFKREECSLLCFNMKVPTEATRNYWFYSQLDIESEYEAEVKHLVINRVDRKKLGPSLRRIELGKHRNQIECITFLDYYFDRCYQSILNSYILTCDMCVNLKKINIIDYSIDNIDYNDLSIYTETYEPFYAGEFYLLEYAYKNISKKIDISINDLTSKEILTTFRLNNLTDLKKLLSEIYNYLSSWFEIGNTDLNIVYEAYDIITKVDIDIIEKQLPTSEFNNTHLFIKPCSKKRLRKSQKMIRMYKFNNNGIKYKEIGNVLPKFLQKSPFVFMIDSESYELYTFNRTDLLYYEEDIENYFDKIFINTSIIKLFCDDRIYFQNLVIINPKNFGDTDLIRQNYSILVDDQNLPKFYRIRHLYFPFNMIAELIDCSNYDSNNEITFDVSMYYFLSYEEISTKKIINLLSFEVENSEQEKKDKNQKTKVHNHLIHWLGFMLLQQLIENGYFSDPHFIDEPVLPHKKLSYSFKYVLNKINNALKEELNFDYREIFYTPFIKDLLNNEIYKNITEEIIDLLYHYYFVKKHYDEILTQSKLDFEKQIKEISYKYLSIESTENIILKPLIPILIKDEITLNSNDYLLTFFKFWDCQWLLQQYDHEYISYYIKETCNFKLLEFLILINKNIKNILEKHIDLIINKICNKFTFFDDKDTEKHLIHILMSIFGAEFINRMSTMLKESKFDNGQRLQFIKWISMDQKEESQFLKKEIKIKEYIMDKLECDNIDMFDINDHHISGLIECESKFYYCLLNHELININQCEENNILTSLYLLEKMLVKDITKQKYNYIIREQLQIENRFELFRSLINNEILILPPELKNPRQYFNKNETFSRSNIKLTNFHIEDHFENLIELIDEQTKLSNFDSILYYNDNITDCSENLKLTANFTKQTLIKQIEQLQQALNYVNKIENDINSYMENQKLTEEEINQIIDLTLEYNQC